MLSLKGYIEIVTNPAHNLKDIEKTLGLPLKLIYTDHKEYYSSETWTIADERSTNGYLRSVTSTVDDPSGNPILIVKVLQDFEDMSTEMKNLQFTGIAINTACIFFVALITVITLQRLVMKPIDNLTNSMGIAAKGNLTVTEQKGQLREINLPSQFFFMLTNSIRYKMLVVSDTSQAIKASANSAGSDAELTKKMVDNQLHDITSAATAITEVAEKVQEIAGNTVLTTELSKLAQEQTKKCPSR